MVRVLRLITIINNEVEKEKISTTEILEAISNFSQSTQDNLKESDSVAISVQDLVKQSIELQKVVGLFDVRSQEIFELQKDIESDLEYKLEEAQKILEDFLARSKKGYYSPFMIAMVYSGLGEDGRCSNCWIVLLRCEIQFNLL